MKKTPWSVTAVHGLILVNGCFWLVFTLLAALGQLPGVLSTGPLRWVMAFLAFSTSCVLGILLYLLIQRKKGAFPLALVLLGLIGILSITDEVGVLDFITLIISFGAILLLVINRDWYLSFTDQDNED